MRFKRAKRRVGAAIKVEEKAKEKEETGRKTTGTTTGTTPGVEIEKGASKNPVASIVQLSKQFKVISDNLGSKVNAANVCPVFEQFFDVEEIVELRELKDEIITAKAAEC